MRNVRALSPDPHRLWETLHPDTNAPVTSGIAKLVATGLYPLLSVQPLIRYDTEDIVEIQDSCPASWTPSLEYVGRKGVVVYRDAGGSIDLLVNPMALHEIVDAEPDVGVQQSKTALALGVTEVGFPKYRLASALERGTVSVTLQIELRWPPSMYPGRAEIFHDKLRRAVLNLSPALTSGLHRGDAAFSIELLPPNSLKEFTEA